MYFFQEANDASWELTLPAYDVDVQSFLIGIDLSGFVDEIVPPETAVVDIDVLNVDPTLFVAMDPAFVTLVDPVGPPADPLVPDAAAATPVTVTDLSSLDLPINLDADAIADAVASALATLEGSFFDLSTFNFGDLSFGPFS